MGDIKFMINCNNPRHSSPKNNPPTPDLKNQDLPSIYRYSRQVGRKVGLLYTKEAMPSIEPVVDPALAIRYGDRDELNLIIVVELGI
jgi:hypothetical protein